MYILVIFYQIFGKKRRDRIYITLKKTEIYLHFRRTKRLRIKICVRAMDEKKYCNTYTLTVFEFPSMDFTARKPKSISEDSLKSFEPSFNL